MSFIQVIFGFKIIGGIVWPKVLLIAKDSSRLYEPQTFITILVSSSLVIPVMWFFHFHLWQNLWAELLRFADRQFYGPWWESRHNSSLLKDWNPLIHIFIKEYLAKPLSKVSWAGHLINAFQIFKTFSILTNRLGSVSKSDFFSYRLLAAWAMTSFFLSLLREAVLYARQATLEDF